MNFDPIRWRAFLRVGDEEKARRLLDRLPVVSRAC